MKKIPYAITCVALALVDSKVLKRTCDKFGVEFVDFCAWYAIEIAKTHDPEIKARITKMANGGRRITFKFKAPLDGETQCRA